MHRTAGKTLAIAITALTLGIAPAAFGCANSPTGPGARTSNALLHTLAAPRLLRPEIAAPGGQAAADSSPKLVGMWEVTQMVGNTLYDHAFQQFFSDGLELQNSGLFPPLVGNMCFGVWTQQDARTFKLKHLGWLFNPVSSFAGTFTLTATITLGSAPIPNTYTATFSVDVTLPNGNIDPSQHADGTMTATRISLN
jgi:hypothetical protein